MKQPIVINILEYIYNLKKLYGQGYRCKWFVLIILLNTIDGGSIQSDNGEYNFLTLLNKMSKNSHLFSVI